MAQRFLRVNLVHRGENVVFRGENLVLRGGNLVLRGGNLVLRGGKLVQFCTIQPNCRINFCHLSANLFGTFI